MIEYAILLVFLTLATILSIIIPTISFLIGIKKHDSEKITIYECGFEPYADSRQKFEVRFLLVAILFIIFDLEISFLFPWSVVLTEIPLLGYWSMCAFLFILTIGLLFEWLKGGLDWE